MYRNNMVFRLIFVDFYHKVLAIWSLDLGLEY